MTLVGARPDASLQAVNPLPGRVNYFLGNDPAKWRRGVPTYSRVVEHDAWPGVDVAYYGTGGQVECDFIVAPGADPGRVELRFAGASGARVEQDGALIVAAPDGETLRLPEPMVYQRMASGTVPVAGHYVVEQAPEAGPRVRLALAAYDRREPLVIDPLVITPSYSTYLGDGYNNLSAQAVAVDGHGQAYITGLDSLSSFVTKLSADGRSVVYSTFIGGRNDKLWYEPTESNAIAVRNGNAYITGWTENTSFPTTHGAFQNTSAMWNNGSAFVIKLDDTGGLDYSTLFNGEGLDLFGRYNATTMPADVGYGIAVDHDGRAWVAGFTSHTWIYETSDALRSTQGDPDNGFLIELGPTGGHIEYSTYLTGNGGSTANAVAIDGDDNVYVVGNTAALNFPVKHAYQAHNHSVLSQGVLDGFIMKFGPQHNLIWSTYLGGRSDETVAAVAVGTGGGVYVTGMTYGYDFPCKSAYQCVRNGTQTFPMAFVTKFNPDGESLAYSSYLHGHHDAAGGTGIATF